MSRLLTLFRIAFANLFSSMLNVFVGLVLLFGAALLVVGACEAGPAPATPPVVAGSSDRPREVNLIARDYAFTPSV